MILGDLEMEHITEQYNQLQYENMKSLQELLILVRSIFSVPIASFSLIGQHEICPKICIGADMGVYPKTNAPEHLMLRHNKVTYLNLNNPSDSMSKKLAMPPIEGAEELRFYAGVPVRTENGITIGSLNMYAFEPKKINKQKEEIFMLLGRQASLALNLEMSTFKAKEQGRYFKQHSHTAYIDKGSNALNMPDIVSKVLGWIDTYKHEEHQINKGDLFEIENYMKQIERVMITSERAPFAVANL